MSIASRHRLGLTLVELLLALAITALIAAAVSGMLVAVTYGSESDRDMRSAVVRNKVIQSRLSAAIRGAAMVLEMGSDHLVLWMGDADGNGMPNLAEIRYILRDGATQELRCHRPDFTGMTPEQIDAVNAAYTLNANFQAATAGARSQSYFPAEVWTNQVTGWTVTADDADVQQAALVSFRLNLQNQAMSDLLVGAAALRNR